MILIQKSAAKLAALGLLFNFFSFTLLAQGSITGQWALRSRKHVSGVEIVNALPALIKISSNDTLLTIERTFFDQYTKAYQLSETLPLNGTTRVMFSPNKTQFTSRILKFEPESILIELSHVVHPEKDKTAYLRRDTVSIVGDKLLLSHMNEGKEMIKDLGTYVRVISPDGTRFSKVNSWEELVKRSKLENKKILIDCFASWCVPCKLMDMEVYNSPIIGHLLNEKYICIKLQFDSTSVYNSTNSVEYRIAKRIEEEFNINAYPTTLIFDSVGKPQHKAVGSMDIEQFTNLIDNLNHKGFGFFNLLAQYHSRTISFDDEENLARMAKSMNEKLISDSVALNHIESISEHKIISVNDLKFLNDFNQSLKLESSIVRRLKAAPATIDASYNAEILTTNLKDAIAMREIIQPILLESYTKKIIPRWTDLSNKIETFFDKTSAMRLIYSIKANWYKKKKDWRNYTANLVKSVSLTKPSAKDDATYYLFMLNNSAWEIFLHSTNNQELQIAIDWMDRVITFAPNDYNSKDTKANLLYKAGRISEAISLEKEVITLAKAKGDSNRQYIELLEKMIKGQPTW